MPASDPTCRTRRLARTDRSGDERGFAMIWFGLVLIVLLTMAGAALDVWGWWYNGTLHQRAADSAALGGVVFMPEDPTQARVIAMDIAQANGIPAGDVTIETSADDPSLAPNELQVTVARRVDTRFLKLVGVTGARVERDAIAQYTSRLPMGSPEQYLGRDPDRGFDPGFWLSVSGRGESKVGGDRYQNYSCGSSTVFNCSSGNSTEYSDQGYAFSVQLNSAPTGPLVIEAYDPAFTPVGSQDCTNTGFMSAADYATHRTAIRAAVVALFPTETQAQTDARYAPGDTIYCQGEEGSTNPSANGQNVNTFIVREPDNTQALDFDNPAVDTGTDPDTGCTRQFRSVDLSPGGSTNRKIYSVLNPTDFPLVPADVTEAAYALRNYRRWVQVCSIPQSTVAGWYSSGFRSVIVQVRSNADLNSPFTTSTNNREGRNHFALRAGYGTATTTSGVSIYAQGRLPIHNGAAGASTTTFYLTRVPPGNAGRTLSLEFYDVADSSQPAKFEVVPPSLSGAFTCTFTRYRGNNNGTNTDEGLGSATASGCTLNGVTNAQYNGKMVDVRMRVPTTYNCTVTDPLDCWIKVRVTYGAGGTVFDHTVWDAGVVGEPVRLVE